MSGFSKGPRGGSSVDGELRGARWTTCRRRTFARAGGRCQACGISLDLKAPLRTRQAYECDHWPTPKWVMREKHERGEITLAEYDRWLKDPANCRALCSPCHKGHTSGGPTPAARPELPYGGPSQAW